MKVIIVLVSLLLADFLFAGIYSGSISDLDTNVSSGINSSFSNSTSSVNVNFSKTDPSVISADEKGATTYKDANLSNSSTIKKLMAHISKMSAGNTNGIINNVIKKNPDLDINVSNKNQLSIDNVAATYHDNKRIREVQKTKDALTTLLNTFGTTNTIRCYIKRKLLPSFYCPLADKDRSYSTGGVANTSEKDAKNKCDSYCQTPQNCLSKKIENFSATKVTNISRSAPVSVNIPVSNIQKLNSLALLIHGKNKEHVNIWISGILDGKVINFVSKMDITLKNTIQKITIPLNIKGLSKIKLTLAAPYSFITSKKNFKIDSSGNGAILDKTILEYADNKYWFCTANQIVKKRADCPTGTIKNVIIGGSPVLLCITEKDLQRGNEFGGYYDQQSCSSTCYEKKECVPTYKNLGSKLTSSIYNVDYGCLSGKDNASCTKALCKEKLFANLMPLKEVVYYNDSVKETTVMNGQAIKGKIRPKYDIAEEMSSNNDPVAKKKLLVSMDKDNAYRSMISNSSYVISGKQLRDSYPLETKATKIGTNGVSIEYVPNSNLFGSRLSYVYVITKNFYIYKEKPLGNTVGIGVPVDLNFKSASYTLVNSNGNLNMFLLKDKIKIFNQSMNMWESYSEPVVLEKMVNTNGDLSTYDKNQIAPATIEKTFNYKKYRLHYLLNNAYLEKLNNSDGVCLKRQASENGYIQKKYSGSADNTGGSVVDYEVYMIISSTKLTYQDLINKINDNSLNLVYRNSSSDSFSSPIAGHGSEKFNNDNIKIFLLGTKNNLTTVGEFTPGFGEEGKNAYIFNFLYKQK